MLPNFSKDDFFGPLDSQNFVIKQGNAAQFSPRCFWPFDFQCLAINIGGNAAHFFPIVFLGHSLFRALSKEKRGKCCPISFQEDFIGPIDLQRFVIEKRRKCCLFPANFYWGHSILRILS